MQGKGVIGIRAAIINGYHEFVRAGIVIDLGKIVCVRGEAEYRGCEPEQKRT